MSEPRLPFDDEDSLEALDFSPAPLQTIDLVDGAVDAIETLLLADGKHSMLAFAEALGATAVKNGAKPANINTPADLAAMERRDGI